MEINCSNPHFMLSPTVANDIQHSDYLFVFGRCIRISPEQRMAILAGRSFHSVFGFAYVDLNKLPINEAYRYVDDVQLMNDDYELFPVFMAAPCGHCELCVTRKIYSYVQRGRFAVEESRCAPYFVTLTYNDAHLPSDGANLKHIQRFKKRLKRNAEIHYRDRGIDFDSSRIKFLITSEYGKKTHRVHYHCMVFGLPQLYENSTTSYYEAVHLFQFCWRENVRQKDKVTGLNRYQSFKEYKDRYPIIFNRPPDYDPYSFGYVNVVAGADGNAVKYILKYAFKGIGGEDLVPAGMNESFISCSCNLGVQWLRQFRPELLKSLNGEFSYVSCLSNSVQQATLCNYYIKKLFPSWSTMVPVGLRRSFVAMSTAAQELVDSPLVNKHVKAAVLATVVDASTRYPFLEMLALRSNSKLADKFSILERVDFIYQKYQECLNYEIDYKNIERLAAERSRYLSFWNKVVIDVRINSAKAKNTLSSLQTNVKLL